MSTRVTPSISSGNFGFLSPFILDHNNDNIMYMPRGGNMLVNKNLDEIPKGSIAPTSTNWSQISGNTLGSNILSLDVSTYPEHHKLYFGAEGGGIFRVDNAHLPTATRSSNLAAGKGFGSRTNWLCLCRSNEFRSCIYYKIKLRGKKHLDE